MAAPGSIDTSSPFFSSIAAQSLVQKNKTKEEQKKEKNKPLKFEALLKKDIESQISTSEIDLPVHLKNLSPEKILENLLDDVHSSGDALKTSLHPSNIIEYKKAVKLFLQYVIQNSYQVSNKTSGKNILKQKKFTQIVVIDEKLEKLTAEILINQKNQIALLAKIEEINGLLVDLLS